MKTLSKPLLALFVLVSPPLAVGSVGRPEPSAITVRCPPAAKPAVPSDYLFYHALVAPHAALSDRPSPHAGCGTRKVIRT